jgi:cell division protease FtsH
MRNTARFIFPLMVVVLLVYLASQTLLPNDSGDNRLEYSELIKRVDSSPDSIRKVTFFPKSRRIEVELVSGATLKSNYTTDLSQYAFEQKLTNHDVLFDSKGTGDSAWWSILTYLLPFVLFFGFWIFLMNQVQGSRRFGRRFGAPSREPPRDTES